MGIKFVINPVVYFVMLIFEVVAMNLAAEIFTDHKSDQKRFIIGSAVMVILVLLIDLFIFDFHKTGIRSLLIMGMLFFQFKYIGQISFVKCAAQTGILFLVMMITDTMVLLFSKIALGDSLMWLFDNYFFMYALYLSLLYMIIFLANMFNFSIIKLDKIRF